MAYKNDLERTREALKKSVRSQNYSDMRESIRDAKSHHNDYTHLESHNKVSLRSIQNHLNYGLAKADYYAKSRKYDNAFSVLYGVLKDTKELPENLRDKYFDAIENRIVRTSYRSEDKKPNALAISTMDEISRMRVGKRRLEDTVSQIATFVGIIGGIFFLSSNITGNIIGNSEILASNFLGIILFFIGITGLVSWMKNKRKSDY